MGVDHVLVYHVEVRDEHVAPKVEAVESLVWELLNVDVVELGDKTYALATHKARATLHDVVDGGVAWLPCGAVRSLREGIIKESTRS